MEKVYNVYFQSGCNYCQSSTGITNSITFVGFNELLEYNSGKEFNVEEIVELIRDFHFEKELGCESCGSIFNLSFFDIEINGKEVKTQKLFSPEKLISEGKRVQIHYENLDEIIVSNENDEDRVRSLDGGALFDVSKNEVTILRKISENKGVLILSGRVENLEFDSEGNVQSINGTTEIYGYSCKYLINRGYDYKGNKLELGKIGYILKVEGKHSFLDCYVHHFFSN